MAATVNKKRKKRGPNLNPRKTRSKLLGCGPAVQCADGWIAVNSTTRQMFSIRQRHIDAGVPRDPERCIVALALYDGIGDQYVYDVGVAITKIIDEDHRVFARFVTPKALGDQIKAWERRRARGLPWGEWKTKPGVQVLGALPESWRLMYEGQDKRSGRKTKSGKRAPPKIVTPEGDAKPKPRRRRAGITRIVRRIASILK